MKTSEYSVSCSCGNWESQGVDDPRHHIRNSFTHIEEDQFKCNECSKECKGIMIMETLEQLQEYYGVESIAQYIFESHMNGQPSQVRELIEEVKQLNDYTVLELLQNLEEYYLPNHDSDVLYFVKKYLI